MRRYIFTQDGIILGDPTEFMGKRLKLNHITFSNNKPINILKGESLFSYTDGASQDVIAAEDGHFTASELTSALSTVNDVMSITRDKAGRAVAEVKKTSVTFIYPKLCCITRLIQVLNLLIRSLITIDCALA